MCNRFITNAFLSHKTREPKTLSNTFERVNFCIETMHRLSQDNTNASCVKRDTVYKHRVV